MILGIIAILLLVAAFFLGIRLGAKQQRKLDAQQLDLLEDLVWKYKLASDSLMITPKSVSTRDRIRKLRPFADALVSDKNK
jgi:hypothetical protein